MGGGREVKSSIGKLKTPITNSSSPGKEATSELDWRIRGIYEDFRRVISTSHVNEAIDEIYYRRRGPNGGATSRDRPRTIWGIPDSTDIALDTECAIWHARRSQFRRRMRARRHQALLGRRSPLRIRRLAPGRRPIRGNLCVSMEDTTGQCIGSTPQPNTNAKLAAFGRNPRARARPRRPQRLPKFRKLPDLSLL